ncbi:hypothetical protein G7Y89_g991 [Cudoniella acicularis]|uniref:EamA domain-containing protein n=1 Tax=Cudoniella acicularis TaxID=354080 RepID=A0A8H4RYZ5_9HELO|nr:hypothetical protein G7Y89_g991 [Cudoniella acicularis]
MTQYNGNGGAEENGSPPVQSTPNVWKSAWLNNKGIILILLSLATGSSMDAIVRYLQQSGEGMHPFQLVFARMSITFLLSSLYMWWTSVPDFPLGNPSVRGWLILRALFGFFGLFCLYLHYLPLAENTVIRFLVPIVTSWACSVFLGQIFSVRQRIAGLIALVGVIIIAQPHSIFGNTDDIDANQAGTVDEVTPTQRLIAICASLIGVVGASGSYTTIRIIGSRAHALISVNYFAFLCTVGSTVALLVIPGGGFTTPHGHLGWFLLVLLGVLGFILQFTLTAGLTLDKSTRATSMLYTQVIFALAFDWAIWGVLPGLWSLFGGSIVIASTLWSALQKVPKPEAEAAKTVDEESALLGTQTEAVEEVAGLRSDSTSTQVLRKIKWVIIGLVTPEFVLFMAWYQLVQAQETATLITKNLNKKRPGAGAGAAANSLEREHLQASDASEREPGEIIQDETDAAADWLRRENLESSDASEREPGEIEQDVDDSISKAPRYLFLTAQGIERLCVLHPEIFEAISLEQSKKNSLAKFLVCLQVVWFMAQCVTRVAQGLSISLLELNTFGHCIIALIIFGAWWDKPLDVSYPTLVEGEAYQETLAWMWMRSFPPSHLLKGVDWNFQCFSDISVERTMVAIYVPENDRPERSCTSPIENSTETLPEEDSMAESHILLNTKKCDPVTLRTGEQLLHTGLTLDRNYKTHGETPMYLSKIDVRRWTLASSLLKTYSLDLDQSVDAKALLRGFRRTNWKIPNDNSALIIAWGML